MYLNFDRSKRGDVIAFGRATIDLYANEMGPMEDADTFRKYVGGSPANTAVAMAKLGLKVGYIGNVSDDPFGRYILCYLEEQSVDISHIETDRTGAKSGVTMGEIKSPSECSFFMYRDGCADLNISCSQLDEAYIKDYKLLLISGTSLSHSPAREAVFLAMEYARRNGVQIAFDLDYRENTWNTPEEAATYYGLAAEKSDMVLGTREEFNVMERLLMPGNMDDRKSAERLLKAGVAVVSIKKGKQGSIVYTKNGAVYQGGIYESQVLKTFGAGDAYSGAFNYSLISGKPMEEALRYAAAGAAITISGHSCSDAMPELSVIEQFMAEHEFVQGRGTDSETTYHGNR